MNNYHSFYQLFVTSPRQDGNPW